MATIRFAVLVSDRAFVPEQGMVETNPRVEHLYQHKADTHECAKAYQREPGRHAIAVELIPDLLVVRTTDTWALHQRGSSELLTFASQEGIAPVTEINPAYKLIPTPIRQAMPVQHGVPQFRQTAALSPTDTGR